VSFTGRPVFHLPLDGVGTQGGTSQDADETVLFVKKKSDLETFACQYHGSLDLDTSCLLGLSAHVVLDRSVMNLGPWDVSHDP